MIQLTDLHYTYGHDSQNTPAAVAGITLSFAPGQFVGLLGENGSGKSTLARLLAGILAPQSGDVVVDGVSITDRARRWEARRRVGLVFQNPDDQLITTTLVEEVAFGPENLGLPRDVIQRNVEDAIALMGLTPFVATPLNELSLGQRQRVAIAGVLAMEPRYIIFDEPSSMAPSPLVGQLIETVKRLARERNIGAIWITHHMDEVAEMDRVVVMSHGAVALDGSPRETLTQIDRLRTLKLDAPPTVLLAQRLRRRGYPIRPGALTVEELCDQVRLYALPADSVRPIVESPMPPLEPTAPREPSTPAAPPLLETRNLSYTHLSGTPFAQQALNDLTSHIPVGALVAFVGPTRAGKSTLLDCFNAIIKPGREMVYFKGRDASAPGFDVEALRRAVSVVYQSPDSQILEDVVGKDVAFSLIRRKAPLAESRRIVQESLEAVGLPYEDFRNRYTYALSGGEKRRVALAGALAGAPEALILDEPMAGLDPSGRDEFVGVLQRLRSQRAMTVVYLTASLDDVTNLADYIYVLDAGSVALEGPPVAIRRQASALEHLGVGLSAVTRLAQALAQVAPGLDTACADLDGLEAELVACLRSAPQAPASEQEALS